MPLFVSIFFSAVAIGWGTLISVRNEWAARWGKKMQSVWGQWAANMVTPGYVRFIGICMIAMGVFVLVVGIVFATTGVQIFL